MPQEQLTPRSSETIVQDDRIQEILSLAARLRDQAGGVLDDAAIEAVAEATGAPADYVRVAVRSLEVEKKQTALEKMRSSFSTIDARLRSSVLVGSLSLCSGVLWGLSDTLRFGSQLVASLGVLAIMAAFITAWSSRDRQSSGLLGGVWGIIHYLGFQIVALFAAVLPLNLNIEKGWGFLILYLVGGFLVGAVGFDIWGQLKKYLGFRDAAAERQALVSQLMDIQDRLKQDDRTAAFLSLDIVGSTRMKSENDPLSIEYTFGEYHRYVEAVVARHAGRIHSTAGDGVICVFDEASHGYDAGRAVMAGLFEFNAFRNRTGTPIVLRAGLHSGQVGAPGMDATRVDFAHVIDLAAHIQKEAPPGTMAVSEVAAQDLPGGLESVGKDRFTIDGVQSAIWRPRSSGVAVAPSSASG